MPSTRRHFLQTTGAAGLALSPAMAQQAKISANDHIQIATIGMGGMGTADTNSSLAVPGVKLVAVCDVYEGRLIRAKEVAGKDLFTTRNYKEILDRKDVDAVIIGTPDHLHAQIAIDAMNAGKDVYCEKPMIQKVEQGHAVVATQKKTGRILQVGSQRVSSIEYEKARQLIQAGAIGELNLVEAWWDRNSAIGAWQYSIPPDASPENIDWERFLGPAPKRPFEPIRLFRWRNYQDYGTGVAGDLFVHLFSGMHYIVGATGPTRIFATGGLRFWKDGRDVPDVMLGLYDYPKTDKHPAFTLALRVNFVSGAGETSGLRFVGSEGVLTIGRGVTLSKHPREKEPGYTISTFPAAVQKEFLKQYHAKYPPRPNTPDSMDGETEERYQAPRGYSDHRHHHQNFIEAVRTRKPVIEDALFGFRAAGPAVLSNVSYFEQRPVLWDPVNLKVKG
ncbi:MAG: Gfo/Idh/MocA family oxidoreductase [Bryobacteraceae bacterium]|nr:Gfo/Idh/MocA family oxidoreductase [Bryobacteraceae bacterium]